MPVFAACFLVIVLASVGLPGLCGFVGEFLVLIGTFTAEKGWLAGVAAAGPRVLVPHADGRPLGHARSSWRRMYLLTMYQKIMFGPLDKPREQGPPTVKDIHGREIWVFGIVVVAASCWASIPSRSWSAASPR